MSLHETTITQLRQQTPGTAHVTHLNVAGSGLLSEQTVQAMQAHLHLEAQHGAMEVGANIAPTVQQTRAMAAQLLNASDDEIYLCSSGSSAWGLAFAALPAWQPGDRILVCRQEWGSNLTLIERKAALCGATVQVIPCLADGTIDVARFEAMLDPTVKLVAITWLPANGGLINPAAQVGQLTHKHNIPYFVDAGQAVGQLPVDVQQIQCDVLKTAGRKHLRGPRGTAMLYVRKSFISQLYPVMLDVQGIPFEMHEHSMVGLVGLHCALKQALALGIEHTWSNVQAMARYAREAMSQVPGLQLHDLGSAQSGLISFTMASLPPAQIKERLTQERINIGANGIAYTPLDMRERKLEMIARVSVSYLTTRDEIDHLVHCLHRL